MVTERQALENAASVLIIGGGLTGCEISGDIAETFPGKRVTLVQRGDKLLPRTPGAHPHVLRTLQALGVRVLMNTHVVRVDEAMSRAITEHGTELEGDKIFQCTGATPNTGFLRDAQSDGDFAAALDAEGYLAVDNNLRVKGFENVFAAGDILQGNNGRIFDAFGSLTGPAERKASCASHHGVVAAMNILRLVEGKGTGSLVRYDCWMSFGGGTSAAISLGKSIGVLACAPEAIGFYNSMGSGLDEATIRREGCQLSAAVQGLKDWVSGFLIAAASMAEGLEGLKGYAATAVPAIVDPLANPEGYEKSVRATLAAMQASAASPAEPAPEPAPEPASERKARRQGFLGRRSGPGTWRFPRSLPPRAPLAPLFSPSAGG